MSVKTLEKTEPWTKKRKSSPKMIGMNMSWIKKSMSWMRKSSSTKSWKKGRRCKILTPLKRLRRIRSQNFFKSMEGFQPRELVTNQWPLEPTAERDTSNNTFDSFFSLFQEQRYAPGFAVPAKTNLFLAITSSITTSPYAGIPPLAGFRSKFYFLPL